MPVTDFLCSVIVNHREQIVRFSGRTADLPITFDCRSWSSRQITDGSPNAFPLFRAMIAHLLPPALSVVGDRHGPFFSALMLEERSANMLGNELSPQNVIEKSRKVVIVVGVSPSAESTDAFIAGDSSECLRGLPEGTDESSAHSFRIGKSDRASNDFDRLRAFLDLKPGDLGT